MRSMFDPDLESSMTGSNSTLALDVDERLLKLKMLDHIWMFWNM